MIIKVIDGDLTKATEDIIGHQVNCQGVMGSGVAMAIRIKFPQAFSSYKEFIRARESEGKSKSDLLGECQIVEVHGNKMIANLFGQIDFNKTGSTWEKKTCVEKLEKCLTKLKHFAKERNLSVALPFKIGSDRGGADWDEVYGVIVKVFSDYKVTLYRL